MKKMLVITSGIFSVILIFTMSINRVTEAEQMREKSIMMNEGGMELEKGKTMREGVMMKEDDMMMKESTMKMDESKPMMDKNKILKEGSMMDDPMKKKKAK